MQLSSEQIITIIASVITLLLLIFAVDWRYFRDWIVIYLFKCLLDLAVSSPIVELKLIKYPVRLLPHFYDTSILFELWVFPVLCILYNQVTREKGIGPIIAYAMLFSAGITAIEYPLELYTKLITYLKWTWFTTFCTLTTTFLISRVFISFFRWGCKHFGENQK